MPLTFKPKYGDPSQIAAGVEGLQPFPLGIREWEMYQQASQLSELFGDLFKRAGEAAEYSGPAGDWARKMLQYLRNISRDFIEPTIGKFKGFPEEVIKDPEFVAREYAPRSDQPTFTYGLSDWKELLKEFHHRATEYGSELDRLLKGRYGGQQ